MGVLEEGGMRVVVIVILTKERTRKRKAEGLEWTTIGWSLP